MFSAVEFHDSDLLTVRKTELPGGIIRVGLSPAAVGLTSGRILLEVREAPALIAIQLS